MHKHCDKKKIYQIRMTNKLDTVTVLLYTVYIMQKHVNEIHNL